MTMGSREQLIQRSIPFLQEVKDMTPGAEMERWLNEKYGEGSALYQDLSRLIKIGVEEGWAANQEVEGPNYRRSRILEPAPETFQFSITAVYMNSADPRRFRDEDDQDVLRGQYHGHPYGELNLVVPRDTGGRVEGFAGLAGAGLDAPRPRQPPLSRGQGRCRHRAVLSAGRTHFLRLQPTGLIVDRAGWRHSTAPPVSWSEHMARAEAKEASGTPSAAQKTFGTYISGAIFLR